MHRWLTPNSLGIEEFCTKLRCHRKEELQDAGAAAADGVESDEVAWGRKKKTKPCGWLFLLLIFPNINKNLVLSIITSQYL